MNEAADLTLSAFFAGWDLFRESALSGAIAGALLGWLGVYVVLGRIVFLAAALPQAAGLGVALALAAQARLGLPAWVPAPILGSVTVAGLATALLASGRRMHRDGMLGLVYAVGAAGTLAVGTRIAADVHEIDDLLFGSGVAVVPEEFRAFAATAAAILALHAWWMRGLSAAAIDPEAARVRGMPVTLLRLVLFGTLAVAVSAGTRVLGALPVFALTVLPPLAALRVSASVPQALVLSAVLGAISGFGGYVAAFLWRLPVGPAQALVAAAILGVAVAARPLVSRLREG
jgi:zinc transport system permease protein